LLGIRRKWQIKIIATQSHIKGRKGLKFNISYLTYIIIINVGIVEDDLKVV
jgi:hypothetical protein